MKFILKTISFFIIIGIASTALWFLTEPSDREKYFNQTIAKATGKSFDETFSKMGNIDDVVNDSVVEPSKEAVQIASKEKENQILGSANGC